MRRPLAAAIFKTLAVYGFAGWTYIAGAALVHPETLNRQLTHFARWPREDTFGAGCFAVSLVSFFAYTLLRDDR